MSLRQEISTEIRSTVCLTRACEKLGIINTLEVAPTGKKVTGEIYDGVEHGIAKVNLVGWKYPVIIKEDGKLVYDNHEGHWGNIKEVDKLLSCYGEEVVMHQLIELEGHYLQERQVHADGTVELTIGIGG